MAITFGTPGVPNQIITNLDSLFSLSLAAYRKELVDNIGASNALLHEIMKGNSYSSQDGGTDIRIPIMYALQNADSYDGYDELPTLPVDGITDAVFQWRQCAAAVVYSMKEVKQNKQRISSIVKARIKQAEMGLQEFFAQSLMWGSANQPGGSITAPYVSPINGSFSVDPISLLVDYTPTDSTVVGGINQSTNAFWRNKTVTAAATTYDGFMLEFDRVFNQCSLGSGGRPNLILMDETSFELLIHAIYQKYRYTDGKVDEAYPFTNITYRGAHVVMDDKVPDVFSGTIPTLVGGSGDPSTLTYGSAFFLNTKFFEIVYEADSDFKMLTDESGKTMFKPTNGDSRLGHFAWMGNVTVSNRRKQGVLGKIPRTLVTP